MRFKTRLRPERVAQLIKICQVLERVDRVCVLHLCSSDEDAVRLVVFADATGSISTFTTLKRVDWFESYRIESHNSNQIGLELDMRNLSRALRSASSADVIVIKLTKKGVPVLAFEIMTALGPIKQEIPVMVLSAARLAEFQEPQHTKCKGVALPPLVKLHAMIERMKALSQTLTIRINFAASSGGGGTRGQQQDCCRLKMKVGTDMVGVSTTYTGLSAASYDVDDHQQQNDGYGGGVGTQQDGGGQSRHGHVHIQTQTQEEDEHDHHQQHEHDHDDDIDMDMDMDGPNAYMNSSSRGQMEAFVDIRNFAKCLHGYHAQPSHALCFIHGTCVMLHLMLPFDVTISYFVARRTLPL